MTETTDNQQKPWLFKPGQSGNPAGRPTGSRNRLGAAFLEAMEADFNQHGVAAIVKVREDRPHEYLKVIAGLLPKEFHFKDSTIDDMSDDELLNVLGSVRSLIAAKSREQATVDNPAAADTGETKH